MAMEDCPSSNRFWKFSSCAKRDGLFSQELQVASSRNSEKKGIFSFVTMRRSSYQEGGGMCDVSQRNRAHVFFLRARAMARRLHEMRLQLWKGSAKKLTLLDFECSSVHSCPPPSPGFQILKKPASSEASEGSSWFSRILFAKKKKKGSLLLCGAGMGAFIVYLLHYARTYATHLPALALNAGSCLVCYLVKSSQKKCDNAGSKRAACFVQGLRRAFSLFRTVVSLLRSTFVGNALVTTALLAILIGMISAVRHFERH